MFCINCGKNLPDGTVFCTECGARQEQPQQPTPAQPVYTAPAAPNAPKPRPEKPVGKNAYFLNYASAQTRLKALIAWGLTAACLLLAVIGCFVTLGTSVENIPVISVFLDEDDVDDAKDIMSDAMDALEDEYEEYEDELEDELSKEEIKLVDKLIKNCKKFAGCFSINNTKRVVKSLDALADKGVEEYLDLDNFDGLDAISAALGVVSTFIWIAGLFGAAFTVGGGMGRITPLVAVGMAFSALNCLLFAGFLFLLLSLAAHICLIVFMTQLNKEYQAYRQSYVNV